MNSGGYIGIIVGILAFIILKSGHPLLLLLPLVCQSAEMAA